MTPFEKICAVRSLRGITSTQKLILLTIATHLGEKDFCYMGYTRLQQECCIAKRNAISDNLSILENKKYVEITPPSEGYKTNRYKINFDTINRSPRVTSNSRLLVTEGYQTSNRRLPRLVTDGYSIEQLNNKEITNTRTHARSDDVAKQTLREINRKVRFKKTEAQDV